MWSVLLSNRRSGTQRDSQSLSHPAPDGTFYEHSSARKHLLTGVDEAKTPSELEQFVSHSQVYMDVTHPLLLCKDWKSGIARTVLATVQAWLKEGYSNLHLCALNSAAGGYVPVEPEPILERLQNDDLSQPAGNCVPTRRGLLKQRVRERLSPLVDRLPAAIRPSARFLARQGLAIGRHGLRWYDRMLPTASASPITPLALSPQDLVISLGATWEMPNSSELCTDLKRQMGFKSVCMIYDVLPFRMPQFFTTGFNRQITTWQANTVRTADLVLTISENSKADLTMLCDQTCTPRPTIKVCRLGEDLFAGAQIAAAPPTGIAPTETFVLQVGTLEVRKNHSLSYHVWRRLAQTYGSSLPKLLIVGSPGWLAGDIIHQIRTDPLTRDRIVFMAHVNDAELAWLYKNCLFTLYPSFYEGWGLPVAESLAFGKCCIASNTSSIPEIGGDLVDMHDPCDWRACLELVTQALLNPTFLPGREHRIRHHYRRTTWVDWATTIRGHIESQFGATFVTQEQCARAA